MDPVERRFVRSLNIVYAIVKAYDGDASWMRRRPNGPSHEDPDRMRRIESSSLGRDMTTIAIMGPPKKLERSVSEAESMGFKVIAAPLLDIIHGSPGAYKKAKSIIMSGYADMAVISSRTAAEACLSAWGEGFADLMAKVEVVTIGDDAAEISEKNGIAVFEKCSSSDELWGLSSVLERKRILLIGSDYSVKAHSEILTKNGAYVSDLIAYRIVFYGRTPEFRRIISEGVAGRIDCFLFTSAVSVNAFVEFVELGNEKTLDVVKGAKIAALGETTAYELSSRGIRTDILPDSASFKDLLKAVMEYFESQPKR